VPIEPAAVQLFQKFTKETGISVVYNAGLGAPLLTQLELQKNSPSVDLYFGNPITVPIGVAQGLFTPINPKIVTNLKDVYPIARLPHNNGVIVAFTDLGMLYNATAFAANGIPAPKKWGDMWGPLLKGKVLLGVPPTDSYTLWYTAFLTQELGGNVANPSAGINFISEHKAWIQNFVSSPALQTAYMETGQAWIVPTSAVVADSLVASNPTFKFAVPASGSPLYWNSVEIVKNSPNPIGAQLLLNFMLSNYFQRGFAVGAYEGPVNKFTKLPKSVASEVPYGPKAVSKLISLNQNKVSNSSSLYGSLWNAEVG
jgi:putative spermidine/putrescine transport system substrate-binding protein